MLVENQSRRRDSKLKQFDRKSDAVRLERSSQSPNKETSDVITAKANLMLLMTFWLKTAYIWTQNSNNLIQKPTLYDLER